MRTSWLLLRTPVFAKSCCKVALLELSDTPILSAISLFRSSGASELMIGYAALCFQKQ
jgi:hypothetical protein